MATMIPPLFKIAIILCLVVSFSACASKPIQPEHSPQVIQAEHDNEHECVPDGSECVRHRHVRHSDQQTDHADHPRSDHRGGHHVADIFAYVIFRVVLEGIVHGLVHH